MAAGPTHLGQWRGQENLRVAAGLLLSQSQDGRDDVARSKHADDAERGGQVGINNPLGTAQSLQDVDQCWTVAHDCGDVLGQCSGGGAHHKEANAPTEQRPALQPPGQTDRPGQPCRCCGAAAPRRQRTRPVLASLGQAEGQPGGPQDQCGKEAEHPPLFAGKGTQPGHPSERREPTQSVVGEITGGSDQEEEAEEGTCATRRPARCRRALSEDRRDSGEHRAGHSDAQGQGEGAPHRHVTAHGHGRDEQQHQSEVGQASHDEGCG